MNCHPGHSEGIPINRENANLSLARYNKVV